MLLAVLISLPLVGIDLTVLSVFGGALGVGIGFGLQKIASNYISGFIILLDRSMRIGDLITVGQRTTVRSRQITTRYTVLRARRHRNHRPQRNADRSVVLNQSYSNARAHRRAGAGGLRHAIWSARWR